MRHLQTYEENYSNYRDKLESCFKQLLLNIKLKKYYKIEDIIKNEERYGPRFTFNFDDGVVRFQVLVYKDIKDVRIKLQGSIDAALSVYYIDAFEFNNLIRNDNFIDKIIKQELLNKYIDCIGFEQYIGKKYDHLKNSEDLGLL